MLLEPKPEYEFTEPEATLLLVGDPHGSRICDDRQEISLSSSPSRRTLLMGNVNETSMSYCHKLNSSMKGSARYSQQTDSTDSLKSNMTCVSPKMGIIQLPSDTFSVAEICDKDEIPECLGSPGLCFSASVKIEAEALDDRVTTGQVYSGSYPTKTGEVSFESNEYKLDHVPFKERISILKISQNSETNHVSHGDSACSGRVSGQTAPVEDAPGLLKVNGVSIDDSPLYDGQMDSDEFLDDGFPEESFRELDNFIAKDISIPSSPPRSMLLVESVNATRIPQCNILNSSMEGLAPSSQRSDSINLPESNTSCVSQKISIFQLPCNDEPEIGHRDEIPQPLPKTMHGIGFSASVKIEAESIDDKVRFGHMQGGSDTIKKEEVSFTAKEDLLDHVTFKERIRVLRISQNNEANHVHDESVCSGSSVHGVGKPLGAIRLRKRKKTATVSARTALEEDAPGLLKVLSEMGISIDDIRLYDRQMDSDDLDDGLPEESFSELEDVITKIFARNTSLLKLAPIRFSKGSRTTYCLECLVALVEQAKYLSLRKLPVEWGWCRDILSFIFVFERHNRIVLERPEYGYATYFFETMASLPISWQINRLIISMKLTSCRLNILENKILQVGKELSEGEAQVLMHYGWTPNTGLGTMLNYRDRVYHDRRTEKYSSEWRSKISSILVAGYNGGSLVSKTYLDEYDAECADVKDSSIKLEV